MSQWIPAIAMMLVSLISYIDRNTLALLAPTILKETNLDAEQYGWIISAFSIAYMIGNPVWGRVLDRAGVAYGMIAAVGFWTLASVSHVFAAGFWMFAVARAALGFGEGATFPGGLRTVVQTLKPHQQSRGIAVAYSGGALGAVVTPILVTPIAAQWGWRGAFWFTGLIGALWIAMWLIVGRRPEVRHSLPTVASNLAHPRFGDPRLWAYMSLYALGCLPLAFVLYGSSLYLAKGLGLPQIQIGKLLWIPPLGWEVGYYFWGWVIDRTGLREKGRFRGLFLLLTALSLPLAAATHTGSLAMSMALMAFAMFIAGGFVVAVMAYGIATFSSQHAGFLAGLSAGSWSAAVAVLMPVFGRLFDQRRYDDAFLLASLVPVVGFGVWIVLARRRFA